MSKIKKVEVYGKRWFQRTYGNTYHSSTVFINDKYAFEIPFNYGYDSQYEQTAINELIKLGLLDKYEFENTYWKTWEENGIEFVSHVQDVDRKRDLGGFDLSSYVVIDENNIKEILKELDINNEAYELKYPPGWHYVRAHNHLENNKYSLVCKEEEYITGQSSISRKGLNSLVGKTGITPNKEKQFIVDRDTYDQMNIDFKKEQDAWIKQSGIEIITESQKMEILDKALKVQNSNGDIFRVNIVMPGDNYGRENCLKNEGEPLIEFWDDDGCEYPLGQFTGARYNASTLLEHNKGNKLSLDGGIPRWTIDADQMDIVIDWISSSQEISTYYSSNEAENNNILDKFNTDCEANNTVITTKHDEIKL